MFSVSSDCPPDDLQSKKIPETPENTVFTGEKRNRSLSSFYQRYKDSNLEMTESESVALPFGDSAISRVISHSQKVLYYIPE